MAVLLVLAAYVFFWQGGVQLFSSNVERLVPGQARSSTDFYQWWASAYFYRGGHGLYPHLRQTLELAMPAWGPLDPTFSRQQLLARSAYPPFAALVVWPLSWLMYASALDVWLLVSCAALAASIWLVQRTCFPRAGPAVRWTAFIAVLVFVMASAPATHEFRVGNVGSLLLLASVCSWLATRRGRYGAAGFTAAAATAFKLFPGLLLLWLAAYGWRPVKWFVIWCVCLLAATILAFGYASHQEYLHVLGITNRWYGFDYNLSVVGFVTRFFNAVGNRPPAATSAAAGMAIATVAALVVITPLLLLVRRAYLAGNAARDYLFATVVLAMIVASPITWSATLLILVAPITLLIARWFDRPLVVAVLAILAITIWLSPGILEWRFRTDRGVGYRSVDLVTILGFKTYAMVALYFAAFATAWKDSRRPRLAN